MSSVDWSEICSVCKGEVRATTYTRGPVLISAQCTQCGASFIEEILTDEEHNFIPADDGKGYKSRIEKIGPCGTYTFWPKPEHGTVGQFGTMPDATLENWTEHFDMDVVNEVMDPTRSAITIYTDGKPQIVWGSEGAMTSEQFAEMLSDNGLDVWDWDKYPESCEGTVTFGGK